MDFKRKLLCFDFVLQLLRGLRGLGEEKKTHCTPAPLITAPVTSAEKSVHNYHVLHLKSAFPDRLHAQEHPCITREARDRWTMSVEQLLVPDRAFASTIQPPLALSRCF